MVEEQVGFDSHHFARFAFEKDHLLLAPFDFLDELERTTARTGSRGELDVVAELIADEWERVVPEHRRQHFLSERARSYRSVVLIDDFQDDHILVDMEPSMLFAFGGDFGSFCRTVRAVFSPSPLCRSNQ